MARTTPGSTPSRATYDSVGYKGGDGIGYSELYQYDSNVTGPITTAAIDAGSLYAYVSFNEKSLFQDAPSNYTSDSARIALAYLNGSNQALVPTNAVDTYCNVTPLVASIGGWSDQTEGFDIPVGARAIV